MDMLAHELLEWTTAEIVTEVGVTEAEVRAVRAWLMARARAAPWALAHEVARRVGWSGTAEELMVEALMRLVRKRG